ncbi:DUF4105 domain-containing protein [Helicobacter kayseriensis]|uniref:Lnb N-terminal periplasmic domain-containing protein n=1 Tax=Helicobacter kayseriensis TaxID=2905877 RepID=UPI001E4BA59F|nr:DUF4105 domain-containing protein [Helicobacter kayseriensis]MCE3047357.1 DUF4105 domain-containing protein [Helicobacter kayseriensis]MCE3048728.1 DUF4105 domain-containing protein [Helicobacter kayseriensis]
MRCSIKFKPFSLILGGIFLPLFVFSKPPTFQQADLNKIAKSREWRNLLHFDKRKSQIDDERFFLSPWGNTDPMSELKATLQAFYAPIPTQLKDLNSKALSLLEEFNAQESGISMGVQDMHAICRFPSRLNYLRSQLHLPNLPTPQCQTFDKLYSKISPKSITLIFASGHINSPASMFGHNFLLFNSKYNSRLLSYALNYSAQVDEANTNGFIFALKGLSGGYNGRYSILPYYDKIKEYAYSENRDMWEFELNLTPQETLIAYQHIWELNNINSDYFFLDENCASNLLWILEIARPSINLRDSFPSVVNPPQTLHIIQDAKLISKTIYRPSKQNKIRAYEKMLSLAELYLVKQIAKGNLSPQGIATHPNQILILECSAELVEFYFMKQQLSLNQYQEIAHNIANARSKLGTSQEIAISAPPSPLQSHREFLISPTFFTNTKNHFLGFETRFTYHGIEDSSIGIQKETSIEFLKALFGISLEQNPKLYLQEITILKLQSLPTISTLIHPISYQFQMGASRDFLNSHLTFYLNGGVGASMALGEHFFAYYLFEPSLYISKIPQIAVTNTLGGVFEASRFKFLITYHNTLYPQNFSSENFIISNALKASINLSINSHCALNFSSHLIFFNKSLPTRMLHKAQIRIYL